MFGWTVDDLCGKSRRRPLVTARQIGMYVFRELTDYSYPQIAEEFGGRDHTTVMHAVEKIQAADDRAPRRLRAGQRADQPDQARRPVDNTVEHWGNLAPHVGTYGTPATIGVRTPVESWWTAVRRPRSPALTCADRRFVHNPQALLLQQDEEFTSQCMCRGGRSEVPVRA